MMTNEINTWRIDTDQGADYTAEFGNEDYERWFLHGRDRTDNVEDADQVDLYENCIYLARAEARRMIQTAQELRSSIAKWASEWNDRLAK